MKEFGMKLLMMILYLQNLKEIHQAILQKSKLYFLNILS
jgi:hypothetical protein